MLQVKIFGEFQYQRIEDGFNEWSSLVHPFIIKSILSTTAVPKQEGGHSLFFTLAVFFNEQTEVLPRNNR
jgi:hypothetical protein